MKNGGYTYAKPGFGAIYALVHPISREIRYIGQTGKTIEFRLKSHIYASGRVSSLNYPLPVSRWIRKLIASGLAPEAVLLEEVEIKDLNTREIARIADGKRTLRLLNVAPGGVIEGRKKGQRQPPEYVERMRVLFKGTGGGNFRDRTGEKHHQLTVIGLDGFRTVEGKRGQCSWWKCVCTCGNTTAVLVTKLGRTKSCGCAKKSRWTPAERLRLSNFYKTKRENKHENAG